MSRNRRKEEKRTRVSKDDLVHIQEEKGNRDDNTLLSITNEKGTKDTGVSFNGTYVGHCVLGKYLVVFTTKSTTEGSTDYIYRVKCEDGEYEVTILYGYYNYNTSLGFDPKHPIEAFGDYETDLV